MYVLFRLIFMCVYVWGRYPWKPGEGMAGMPWSWSYKQL